jgi:hypothetical protein
VPHGEVFVFAIFTALLAFGFLAGQFLKYMSRAGKSLSYLGSFQ